MLDRVYTRLIISHLTIVILCLAIVGIAFLLMLRPYQNQIAYERLTRAMPLVYRIVNQAIERRNIAPERLLQELSTRDPDRWGDMRLLIVDLEAQQVVGDSEGAWEGTSFPVETASPINVSRGIWRTPEGERALYLARPLNGTSYALVLLTYRQTSLDLIVQILSRLGLAGAIAFVASILLALVIARSLARPLQEAARAAERVATGDYTARLSLRSPEEARRFSTHFNAMVEAIQATQQAQRDFVANVSHELKTPLTSIQGFSQAILDGTAQTPEAIQQAAQIIHDEADRLTHLVRDLLDLAQLESRSIPISQHPIDLSALLKRCVEQQALRAKQQGITLAFDTPPGLIVSGDGDRLVQVFTNLLDNAIKHTPAGGTIRVEASRQGDHILASVADTGSGIPPEDLPHIFDRFYQVDKSRSRKHGGAGLGLAIAREIIRAHGGEIKAESIVGLGSRFTVILPTGRESS